MTTVIRTTKTVGVFVCWDTAEAAEPSAALSARSSSAGQQQQQQLQQ